MLQYIATMSICKMTWNSMMVSRQREQDIPLPSLIEIFFSFAKWASLVSKWLRPLICALSILFGVALRKWASNRWLYQSDLFYFTIWNYFRFCINYFSLIHFFSFSILFEKKVHSDFSLIIVRYFRAAF